MIAKELIDARWKAIIGMALAIITALLGAFTFDLVKTALSTSNLNNAPSFLGDAISRLNNYDAYIWSQNYNVAGNTGLILMIVALLIGSSVIANEVSKSTIFLILSRPLSRDRILLTKYVVGAVVLLGMNVVVSLVLIAGSAIMGHSVDVAGVAVSALLFWLGTLFVLGISTLFSVVFSDVLRPLALTVVLLAGAEPARHLPERRRLGASQLLEQPPCIHGARVSPQRADRSAGGRPAAYTGRSTTVPKASLLTELIVAS